MKKMKKKDKAHEKLDPRSFQVFCIPSLSLPFCIIFSIMSKRAKLTHHDPEAHSRHLKRQLESLERDNHTSISSVEGLVTGALTAQEEEGLK